VSGGGGNSGATTGGGGGSFGSGGGGGGGMSGMSSSGGGMSGSSDWSSFRGSRSANGRMDMRAAEPSYARSVPPGERAIARSGSRPRGDSPVLGQAIPREVPIDRSNRGGISTRFDPFWLSAGYYYSPFSSCNFGWSRRCLPTDPFYAGYGYYGLNSLFFDPYWFYEGQATGPVALNPAAGLGSLRLKVKPAKGQVFIDGYYVGDVDEFDGAFQKIKLEQGKHRVEIRLLGYEPLVFDVDIRRGQQTVFEGQLRPRQ
jgi:PEGA domain